MTTWRNVGFTQIPLHYCYERCNKLSKVSHVLKKKLYIARISLHRPPMTMDFKSREVFPPSAQRPIQIIHQVRCEFWGLIRSVLVRSVFELLTSNSFMDTSSSSSDQQRANLTM